MAAPPVPPPVPAPVRAALADLRRALKALYGERLHALVLYGSYARGEAHDESDVDVLVVLRGPVRAADELRRMTEAIYPLELSHGLLLSTLPMAQEKYERGDASLLANVRAEGIPV